MNEDETHRRVRRHLSSSSPPSHRVCPSLHPHPWRRKYRRLHDARCGPASIHAQTRRLRARRAPRSLTSTCDATYGVLRRKVARSTFTQSGKTTTATAILDQTLALTVKYWPVLSSEAHTLAVSALRQICKSYQAAIREQANLLPSLRAIPELLTFEVSEVAVEAGGAIIGSRPIYREGVLLQ